MMTETTEASDELKIRYRAGIYPEGTVETEVIFGYDIKEVVDAARGKCRNPDDDFWYDIWVQAPEGEGYRTGFVGEYHAAHSAREAVRDVKLFEKNFPK